MDPNPHPTLFSFQQTSIQQTQILFKIIVNSVSDQSTAMSTPSRKTVLKSSDGKLFEAEEAAAQLSLMIKHMIEDDRAENCVPITGDILSRVIAYCRKHASAAVADDEALKSFDSEFIKVDEATLFHMANAARFLDIKCLSNLLCEALADRRKKRRSNRELHRRVSQKTFGLNSVKVLLDFPY